MKELICIVCPKGCHLKIDESLNVTGNGCNRGIEYGINELTNPTRMVTSTVVVVGGELSRCSVATSKPRSRCRYYRNKGYKRKVIL